MKRFLLYIGGLLGTTLLLISLLVVMIYTYPNHFDESYQAVIQRKYDVLVRTNEPKIIILGGSNASFGIDEKMIEQETGYKVANLGLHAGFGALFYTELSKANINSGDIVLLAYEASWVNDGFFERIGTDLVMSGINKRLDIYRWIPTSQYLNLLRYLPDFARKEILSSPADGVYSAKAFDEYGQMIFDRPAYILEDYQNRVDKFGSINIHSGAISENSVTYLREFKHYVESLGASIYFVAHPMLQDAVVSSVEDFWTMTENEEIQIGIPYLSNPADYIFPAELMYDTIYHCNSEGARVRTDLLLHDLQSAGVV